MPGKHIIIFDGVCNFCNYWINFIIKRDKNDHYMYAALQSEAGQKIMNELGISNSSPETVILVDSDKFYFKSTAVLRIIKNLSGPIKIFYPFIILPEFFRDFIYGIVAKNRYKLFGIKESCRVPTKEERKKFL